MLCKEKINSILSGVETIVYKNIDSTNNEAKKQARLGEKMPCLICAETQSAGRGRLGRSFYSPEGTGLYMSLAYIAKGDMASAVTITSAAAVATAKAIDKLCGTDCKIKWVNDIYVNDRKVCGILAEAVSRDSENVIIVGIGINCTTIDFPDDIKSRAGSVGMVDRSALAAEITKNLLVYAEDSFDRSWLAEYKDRSIVLGREITYIENDAEHIAFATDIDENGGLVINEKGNKKTLFTGEISIKL